MRSSIHILLAVALLIPLDARAREVGDEPGAESRLLDEPSPTIHQATSLSPATISRLPMFRLELAFGYNTLLVDPDVGQGYGGGIYFAWGLHRRWGVEASVFFGRNPFQGQLGSYGNAFLTGNVTAGPILQLTRPGGRFSVTLETGLGTYLIVPVLEANTWSLGFYGGVTAAVRLTRWLGIGIKMRYHLFNVATISGPGYRDLKSFTSVGVVDRLEIPVYVAFYF
jgi:hypothetical protein